MTRRHHTQFFHRQFAYLLGGLALSAQVTRLVRPYQLLQARVIRGTGLFDDEFYRQKNPDVVAAGMDSLWHFVTCGDGEGRMPMPLFDPAYYRSNAGPHAPRKLNSLVHYALLGRYAGNPTSPRFDTAYYLRENRDVKFSGMDPLFHYVRYGQREGRQATEHGVGSSRLDFAHIAAKLLDLTVPKARSPALVDVVVPVFKGPAETLHCLYNALRFQQATPFELIVVNDASPIEQLVDVLVRLAGMGRITYLENAENQGFVRSVNRGMSLHQDRDIVLLNSDAEPYNDWLDRLRGAAYREDKIATVTPLSNNATICSYPVFNQDNPHPLELTGEEVDRLARRVNAADAVAAPTAVGFCMYIRRQAIAELGLFDEAAFEHGYGEENDFCQRAIRNGWKNLIATDVYVWHWGACSFLGTKGKRVAHALRVLDQRFPNYRGDVAAFVAHDPLAPARLRLDEARLTHKAGKQRVLIVSHQRGGGAERFVQEEVRRLEGSGASVFFLRSEGASGQGRFSSTTVRQLPNLDHVDFCDPDTVHGTLEDLAISYIEVHQLVDFDIAAADALERAARRLGIRLEIFVHDYQAICARINLVGPTGIYCGEPDEEACRRCLEKPVRGLHKPLSKDIRLWRQIYRGLYEAADAVVVPDEDVAIRLGRYMANAKVRVQPHEMLPACPPVPEPVLEAGDMLRVVVPGAIGKIKGFDVLRACALDARRRRLPIKFLLMGYSLNDRVLENSGVTITGRYQDEAADDILRALSPHAIWLPAVWPETYSYTLSLALRVGYPTFAFDTGAIARRLRQAGQSDRLMPLAMSNSARSINDAFMAYREGLLARPTKSMHSS